ncbi:ORF55 [Agrotis segetum granulovirus]|uniref:ORF55 n=1 Tax=Agrotis segetum granulosis virus TaxID=10464 RepID=Q6QXJ8_GVAS|nr:ORF55 [Agrotis segetum granulovirus]
MSIQRTSSNFIVPRLNLPAWIKEGKSYLACLHKKSPLGYILQPNTKISYKLSSSIDTGHGSPVTLRFLNNDSKTETSLTINSFTENEYIVQHQCVPFVDWVLYRHAVTIEFTITGEHTVLPQINYVFSNNVQGFFTYDTPYAFVQFGKIVVLVPPSARLAFINGNSDFLNNIYDFYNNAISIYDNLIGLKDGIALADVDANFDKQMFFKQDLSGSGAAYYGPFWIGVTTQSFDLFYNVSISNWIMLHVMGHAYDFEFANSKSIFEETWASIFADRYQFFRSTKMERYLTNTVFGPQMYSQIITDINILFSARTPFPAWPEFRKLLILSLILNTKHGEDGFRELNRSFRRKQIGMVFESGQIFSLLLRNYSHYDLYYYFKMILQVPITDYYMHYTNADNITFKPYYHQYEGLARNKQCLNSLNSEITIMSSESFSDHLIKTYYDTQFALVTPTDVLPYNNGSTTFYIRAVSGTHIFNNDLVGKTIIIMNGDTVVEECIIRLSGTLYFEMSVNRGLFHIVHPRGNLRYYVPDNTRIVTDTTIKATDVQNVDAVQYYLRPYVYSELEIETGHVLGEANVYAATIHINYKDRTISIQVFDANPVPSFPNSILFRLRLHNVVTMQEESFVLNGINANINLQEEYVLKYNINDRLELTYNNLATGNNTLQIMYFLETRIQNSTTFTYVLLEDDIYPEQNALHYPSKLQRLMKRIDKLTAWLDNRPKMLKYDSKLRESIYLCWDKLKDNEYKDSLIKYLPNSLRDSTEYHLEALTIYNHVIADIKYNALLNRCIINYYKHFDAIHVFFHQIYFGMQIKNPLGQIIYKKLFRGSHEMTDAFLSFPLCDGSVVQIFHREPGRLLLYKENVREPVDFQQDTYLLVKNAKLHLIPDMPSILPIFPTPPPTPEPTPPPTPEPTPPPTPEPTPPPTPEPTPPPTPEPTPPPTPEPTPPPTPEPTPPPTPEPTPPPTPEPTPAPTPEPTPPPTPEPTPPPTPSPPPTPPSTPPLFFRF